MIQILYLYIYISFFEWTITSQPEKEKWLVVSTPKNMKVSWDHEIPNEWKQNKKMATKPPTSSGYGTSPWDLHRNDPTKMESQPWISMDNRPPTPPTHEFQLLPADPE